MAIMGGEFLCQKWITFTHHTDRRRWEREDQEPPQNARIALLLRGNWWKNPNHQLPLAKEKRIKSREKNGRKEWGNGRRVHHIYLGGSPCQEVDSTTATRLAQTKRRSNGFRWKQKMEIGKKDGRRTAKSQQPQRSQTQSRKRTKQTKANVTGCTQYQSQHFLEKSSWSYNAAFRTLILAHIAGE